MIIKNNNNNKGTRYLITLKKKKVEGVIAKHEGEKDYLSESQPHIRVLTFPVSNHPVIKVMHQTEQTRSEVGWGGRAGRFLVQRSIDHFRITAIWPGWQFADPNTQLKTRLDAAVARECIVFQRDELCTNHEILHTYLPFYIWSWYIYETKVHIKNIYYYKFETKLLLITNKN